MRDQLNAGAISETTRRGPTSTNLVVIIINLFSEGSLIKILILEINDKVLVSLRSFKRFPLNLVYKTKA